MRGVDALAEACKPEESPAEGAAGSPTLSEDMVNKIADKVVQKLQQTEQPGGSEEGGSGTQEGSAGEGEGGTGMQEGSAGTEEGGGADD